MPAVLLKLKERGIFFSLQHIVSVLNEEGYVNEEGLFCLSFSMLKKVIVNGKLRNTDDSGIPYRVPVGCLVMNESDINWLVELLNKKKKKQN